jgi:enediyne biosynthesis thioesterase
MRRFDYHHTVTLEDTNFVGNVYFTRYFSWQGRCRELFLREHAPAVLDELSADLALVTVRCSCDFFDELRMSDEVVVSMGLQGTQQNRVAMDFEYARIAPDSRTLVARGAQEVACMRRVDGRLHASPVPEALRSALAEYRPRRATFAPAAS